MKIGIHHREKSFSSYWIQYCIDHNVSYKIVDCYSNDIVSNLNDCNILMWHWHHGDAKAVLFARQLIYSLETAGKIVYPNSETCWHFDDKLGQKYLLESIGAPLIPSHVFYDRVGALNWMKSVEFPKVFKLRGGAGSVNVKLIRNKSQGLALVNKAFKKGFAPRDRFAEFKDKFNMLKQNRDYQALKHVVRGLGRLIIPTEFEKLAPHEKGYIYIQEFMPNNTYDTRVVVVGDKCFTIRRYNRENDFRASGSGKSGHSPELFDKRCLEIAFQTSERIGAQSIAYDFIFDPEGHPKIVEMSYAFVTKVYPGYWDRNLNWIEGACNSQYFLMDDIISSYNQKSVSYPK